jgi:FkbM family methyltransferase
MRTNITLKKTVRTVQSNFWFLKEAKDTFYIGYRRLRRVPSEPFFCALPLIASRFSGTYIDVGANIGQSIEAIKLFVPQAKIYSFEPNPNLAAKLQSRYRGDSLVEVRALGLSSSESRMKLYVPSYKGFVYDGLGSLDYNSAKSWLSDETVFFFRPEHLIVHEYEVRVETLDMQNIVNPIFIKIDVQETEHEVVVGGINTLQKYEPILLIEDYHERPALQKLAASLGYDAFHFNGHEFAPGASDTSSFLMTPLRWKALEIQPGT